MKRELDPEIRKKIEKHPCYCAGAHFKYSRIHLPVAPACNIQCNYCNRKFDCSNESRPGVTSGVLKPAEALEKYISAKHALPNLTVAGIAGPGDALANPHESFAAFRLIKEYDPEVKLCISTNGLALPEWVDEIEKIGIEHVTVTVNAVNPDVAVQIYDNIGGKKGVDAVNELLANQLKGISMLVQRGILVKINSVLIPNINDKHLKDVAAKMKELGVFIHNIIPLISKKEFGTKFGFDGVPEPDCAMLAAVRNECAKEMGGEEKIMSHCRQCRADAAGLIGEKSVSVSELHADEHKMKHYGDVFNKINSGIRSVISAEIKELELDREFTAACASAEGHMLDIGFGKAQMFTTFTFKPNGIIEEGRSSVTPVNTFEYAGGAAQALRTFLTDYDISVFKSVPKSAHEGLKESGVIAVTAKPYGLCLSEAWEAVKNVFLNDKILEKVRNESN